MSQKPASALYIPRGKDACRPSRQRLPSDSSTMTTGDICRSTPEGQTAGPAHHHHFLCLSGHSCSSGGGGASSRGVHAQQTAAFKGCETASNSAPCW